MKPVFIAAAFLLTLCASAEEKVTVTVFKMKDGRTIEVLRIAAIGDEGTRTFTLKTTIGERVMILEADIESRVEKKVARSELPETAAVAPAATASAIAKSKEEDEVKQSQKLAAVHKDVDARIALRKIDDEIAQAKAKLTPFQQAVAEATAAIAAAQVNADSTTKELSGIPEPKAKASQDPASRDAENKREARRESLRKRIKVAEDEKAKQTQRKAEAEKVISDGNDQIKKLTDKRDAALKMSESAAAEKSKAIVSELPSDTATLKKSAGPAGDSVLHTLKMNDGSIAHARSMKKLDGGILLIVDDTGVERRIPAADVQKID